MARAKRFVTPDSVFRTSTQMASASPQEPRSVVSPPATGEKPKQTSVWLGKEETHWLDRHWQQLRENGWPNANRSVVIRALVKVAMSEEGIDLDGVSNEAELVERLRRR